MSKEIIGSEEAIGITNTFIEKYFSFKWRFERHKSIYHDRGIIIVIVKVCNEEHTSNDASTLVQNEPFFKVLGPHLKRSVRKLEFPIYIGLVLSRTRSADQFKSNVRATRASESQRSDVYTTWCLRTGLRRKTRVHCIQSVDLFEALHLQHQLWKPPARSQKYLQGKYNLRFTDLKVKSNYQGC